MSSFIITLISNAKESAKVYPNNTVARFTTQLLDPVELDGNYEMALKEFICPISFYNVTKGEYYVSVVKRHLNMPNLDPGIASDIAAAIKNKKKKTGLSAKFEGISVPITSSVY